jgi:hypothetical protein
MRPMPNLTKIAKKARTRYGCAIRRAVASGGTASASRRARSCDYQMIFTLMGLLIKQVLKQFINNLFAPIYISLAVVGLVPELWRPPFGAVPGTSNSLYFGCTAPLPWRATRALLRGLVARSRAREPRR